MKKGGGWNKGKIIIKPVLIYFQKCRSETETHHKVYLCRIRFIYAG